MAIVLRFPDRVRAVSTPSSTERPAAEVVILPCIRREPIDAAGLPHGAALEQLQA
jgi:hypothetical protein